MHWHSKVQNMQIKLQARQEDLEQDKLAFLIWFKIRCAKSSLKSKRCCDSPGIWTEEWDKQQKERLLFLNWRIYITLKSGGDLLSTQHPLVKEPGRSKDSKDNPFVHPSQFTDRQQVSAIFLENKLNGSQITQRKGTVLPVDLHRTEVTSDCPARPQLKCPSGIFIFHFFLGSSADDQF